jgi:hypothetical protein
MDQKEEPRVVPASAEDLVSEDSLVESSSQKETPTSISKSQWIAPVLESLGPVCEATNGTTTGGGLP